MQPNKLKLKINQKAEYPTSNKFKINTKVKLQNQALRLESHPRPNSSISYFKLKYLSHLSISMDCLI